MDIYSIIDSDLAEIFIEYPIKQIVKLANLR